MDERLMHVILDTLLEYIDEGIHVIDGDGRTIIYNKAMERLEGLKRDDVIGSRLLDVFPSLNERSSTLCSTLENKAPIIDLYQSYINKSGRSITTLNSTIPLLDGGEAIGSLEIAKDYTGLKSLYEKISALQIELMKSSPAGKGKRKYYVFDDLLGISREFLNEVAIAKTASSSSSTVLIYGETGTGKELVAQSIHSAGDRRGRPFIAQNCAAIPEGLLEGLLFGTVRGGFTGAINRPGLFEQANGGTLMLDEINSMDMKMQSKLLRVLQEGYIRRVGGIDDIPVDVRIIATANVPPLRAVEEGTLRRDLYYRLNVIGINLPPLRMRREDIPVLTEHFIKYYNSFLGKDVRRISFEVEAAFQSYSWPGNVRELKNCIESAMNMSSGDTLERKDFSPELQSNLFGEGGSIVEGPSGGKGLPQAVESYEKEIIIRAMALTGGNISSCARLLKIKRQTLQHKLKKYAIR